MRRLFQGAATVDSILRGDLIERAAAAGLRSLFVGFETLTPGNLASSNKRQNLGRDYAAVTDRLHSLGIMINGSFVFGMDDDDEDVFRRTVDWAVEHGITTATFHIQTPYPGTRLFARTEAAGRILTRDWDLYDTRHVVYQPARLTPEALKTGYDWAYREFYRWSSIAQASLSHGSLKHQAKHFFYAGGLEEVRAAVGRGDPRAAARRDDAGARERLVEGDGHASHTAARRQSPDRPTAVEPKSPRQPDMDIECPRMTLHRPVHAPNLPKPVGPYSAGHGFRAPRLCLRSGRDRSGDRATGRAGRRGADRAVPEECARDPQAGGHRSVRASCGVACFSSTCASSIG